ncbi:MAG: PAS domain-containing protein [Deltaproteobacteria bacterium]|nr:MAG: PAS domain-containing protein [Deltaproteobacteria bacterium]
MEDEAKTREQLIHELQHLRQRVSGLEASDAQLRKNREELNVETHQLAERTKELNCLYGITDILAKPGTSLPDILQGIVELLPPAFQYPEITASRLTLDNETFTAGNFHETAWKHTENIMVQGERVGSLEVCYLKKRPKQDKGPFLSYEIGMLKALSIGLGRVIERTKIQEALKRSEETARALLNAPHDWAVLIDPEGTILAINRTGAERLEKGEEGLVGTCVFDHFEPAVSEFRRARTDEVAASGEPLRFIEHRDEKIFDVSVYPVVGERDAVERIAVVAHEITDLIRAQEALRDAEAQKQAILDASVDRIKLTDPDMRIIWANKTTAKQLNIGPEELVGQYCFEALVGRSSPCSGCPSRKALKSGHMEHALVRRSGSKSTKGDAYWDNYAVPIKNESGDIVHLVQITRNVTRQKLAEKTLKERENELKLKAASLADLNTALRVLLEQKDNDTADIEEKVMLNMRELVIPFIEKLKKTSLTSKQAAYVQVLESNLNDVISPFSRTLSAKFLSLTPTEIQIAGMVREGKMSQEIADVLNLSKRTVESHRAGIRKKLGLKNKKANLRSHLLSM